MDYAGVCWCKLCFFAPHYMETFEIIKKTGECEKGNEQTFGSTYNSHNSAYVRAIETRLNEDKGWLVYYFS